MMPFSVLRSFLLFIISWALLGGAIYLAYDAYHNFQTHDVQATSIRVPSRIGNETSNETTILDDLPQERTVVIQNTDNSWYAWGELAVAILCLGLCIGGRAPVRMFMKRGSATQSQTPPPGSSFEVSRPDGSRLHCQSFGSEQRPTLLLTHGWSLDSSAWRYMLASLVPRYRVVVWDLPGLGKSRGPENNDFSLEKLAQDLNAVLEHMAADGPVVLVGHSIGGMTQQTFCRLHSEKLGKSVKGMVMLQTTYTNPLATNALSAVAKPLQPLIAGMNFIMIPLAPVFWLSNWQSYFNGSLHWAARLESFTGKQTWEQLDHSAKLGAKAWPAVLARGNFGMMKFNEEHALPDINVPVLIVSGSNDILTVQSASRRIEHLIPNSQPSSHADGHLGHWEYNAEVSQTILAFAAGVFDKPNVSTIPIQAM